MSTYNIKWLNNIRKFVPPTLSTTQINTLKLGGHFKWRSVKQKKNKKRTFRKKLKKFR